MVNPGGFRWCVAGGPLCRTLIDSGVAGAERFEEWSELREQLGRGSETELESRVTPSEVTDLRASLAGDQCTGCVVPWLQTAFVVGVDPTAGHRAQVDRCRSHTPDVAHLGEKLRENRGLTASTLGLIGEAGGDEAVGETSLGGDSDGHTVAGGALTPHRREDLMVEWVMHHSHKDLAIDLGCDGDGEPGVSIEVIGCPVDGIDDPTHAAGAGPIGALLAKDSVIGSDGKDGIHDQSFRGPVHLGDHVGAGGLGVDGSAGAGETIDQDRRCCRGNIDGQSEEFGSLNR